MKRIRLLSALLSALLLSATTVRAQYELKAGNFNSTFVPQAADGSAALPFGPPSPSSPPPSAWQFSGAGAISGSAGPLSNTSNFVDRYPANATKTLVLTRATAGGTFASGLPRFSMGEIITTPLTQADEVTPADADYWRIRPVSPGEAVYFENANQVIIPTSTVSVTSAGTNSSTVAVESVPPELVLGATLLGQPVTRIVGTSISLGGNANATISSATPSVISPPLTYYYSPHAEKVFATQPGRVTITWVTRLPVNGLNYGVKTETFAVSSTTKSPIRTIYWTEGSFDGPKVRISDGRITSVNPIYYNAVPKAVGEEVQIPGYNPITPNLKTLAFEKFNGVGQLQAYNVEGRIFVEYLGDVRLAGNIHEYVGSDVVDIKRVPKLNYTPIHLGKEILPHTGDATLTPSPVLAGAQDAGSYYGTHPRADNSLSYFAERSTSPEKFPDDGSPASVDAFNKVVFYWLQTGTFGIQWPLFQNRYWLRWSPELSDYAHHTVDPGGSTPETGISFTEGVLPQLVFQDDPAQTEAAIDINTQRFHVNPGADQRNRSLLKFSSGSSVWYVNIYSQAETRSLTLASTVDATTVTVASTAGLEVGMIVSGNGIGGTVVVTAIIDGTRIMVSEVIPGGAGNLTYTVESDAAAPIQASATVGTRLSPPAGHENAGHVSGGTGYYPQGYLNPLVVGAKTANSGAIIPVNSRPGENQLTVRWFRKIPAPNAAFKDLYVPGKIGRYTIGFPPATTPEIVIARGIGTGDLPLAESTGSVYYQNDITKPGFNPNEEHAFMLGGRAYALRDDLNIASTSQACVLVAYTDPADQRPAMRAYNVVRSNETYDFNYVATAGTQLVKPYPLPLMSLPLVGTGSDMRSKDVEITGGDAPANTAVAADTAYTDFTFQDRKGFVWVHRGPHSEATAPPEFGMKLYYPSREGFFIPGMSSQPAVGTVLPFLRQSGRSGQPLDPSAINVGQTDEPLLITYRPAWPNQTPELRVAETLTLPKFGLPQVRGQASASVLYQQSIANDATNTLLKTSVTLHDPTREKTIELDAPGIGLAGVPATIATTASQGKTYFQGLPPHLQQRFFLDPLRSAKGSLVFLGTFHNVIAGEDYLDLNVLSAAEILALKDLAAATDPDKSKWDAAIDALATTVETFKEDPALAGTYIPDPARDQIVTASELAKISNPDSAVDSYAVTATGQGTGYVTMVFGDGEAFTPEGDPVQVKVFKIAPELYTGDLKVIASSNPLDEQVTLRHSADLAGKPEDYEFEWRWTTGAATAPAVYTISMATRIGDPAAGSQQWRVVGDPGSMRPAADQYSTVTPVALPRSENVRPAGYDNDEKAAGLPGVVLKSVSGVDFTGGVPGDIYFSAALGSQDGCVLYVNGVAAVAYNAPESIFTPANASSGLVTGALPLQFKVAPGYFTSGPNIIEVAIYTNADPGSVSTLDFRLQAATETDAVTSGTAWQTATDPTGMNTNTAIVGGSPLNPFGASPFVLNDRWFTMRYRPKAEANNVLGTPYSRWMPPQFVEGWVKRVLAAINPFEQRVKDLNNSAVNTDTSVLTQAGTRWEGDIALTISNINDVGLIEIYETVLNRAKAISIDANTNDPDTNNALILAAGYLNDLYTLLGNEAYADAANPTISVDDQGASTQVNTSRFSFEGQVASSLDEELALLRGRDDMVSPGVGIAPGYNRLYWNYTRGINSGEAVYALNYNIKEKAGSGTANGVIDEADAQRMFPQGHGDSYGHYLTALKGYYKLLANPNFTWTPRAEAVTVLGQAVTVDYFDERKLAGAAGNIARAAGQVLALTWRQAYKDDPATGWNHFRDRLATNTQTGVTRRQGFDEWASRSTQGALYHWAVANSLLPEEDLIHTGIQKIDRTTVPEIAQLPAAAAGFQTTMDSANSHLNPLGLSPDAIAFDISPAELQNGVSHYEQISGRALKALNNAAGAFNQAAVMTGSLRNQEISLDDFNTGIVQQEYAYEDELAEVFGTPYSGDIGAGKTYAQGYSGPDLFHWYIVDRPNNLVDTGRTFTITLQEAKEFNAFTGNKIADIVNGLDNNTAVTTRTVTVQPSQMVQYNDVWKPGGLGARAETGELQDALLDAHQSYLALSEAKTNHDKETADLRQSIIIFNDLVSMHERHLGELETAQNTVIALESVKLALETTAASLALVASGATDLGDTIAEFFPKSVGLATDATSAARGAAKAASEIFATVMDSLSIAAQAGAGATGIGILRVDQDLDAALTKLGFSHEEKQAAFEFASAYRDLVSHSHELMQLTIDYQRSLQNVSNVLAKGNTILARRELFRQRAAAVVQGYRTRDVTFRLFRNEALEQYRSLFDLASRYSYLAAKSYDYETGLLGSTQGKQIFKEIVSSRSLGDLTDGVPQLTTSTLGDGGLANTMARLNADFSVAEGRLGINNPDHYDTVFSLRAELFRIRTDEALTADDDAWQQTLEQHISSNVLSDPDVATYCRSIRKPDGSAVPGIIIPFSTSIQHGKNFFGLSYAAGDHAYTPSNYATKIGSVGIALPGYVGMDSYAAGEMNAGAPASGAPNALGATPYAYLIPCGIDYMLAPPLGDTQTLRSWKVADQALPLPFNLGASAFNSTQYFSASGTLTEQPWIIRKHQAFRPVGDPSFFFSEIPTEFTNARLIGRSVWNGKWKLVIPAYTLLNDEQEGLNRFAASVRDVQLFLRTYSHSGN